MNGFEFHTPNNDTYSPTKLHDNGTAILPNVNIKNIVEYYKKKLIN